MWSTCVRHFLNFDLDENWSMSIEDKGSAVVRYKAKKHALILVQYRISINTVKTDQISFSEGQEILIIGSTVYLPKSIDAGQGNPDWNQLGSYHI